MPGSALRCALVRRLVDEQAGLGRVVAMLVSCPTCAVGECDRLGIPQYLFRLLGWQDLLLNPEGLSDRYYLRGEGEFAVIDPLVVPLHYVDEVIITMLRTIAASAIRLHAADSFTHPDS